MDLAEIDKKVSSIEDMAKKVRELVTDMNVCTSNVTKTLISSAVKKYLSVVAEDAKAALDATSKDQPNEH